VQRAWRTKRQAYVVIVRSADGSKRTAREGREQRGRHVRREREAVVVRRCLRRRERGEQGSFVSACPFCHAVSRGVTGSSPPAARSPAPSGSSMARKWPAPRTVPPHPGSGSSEKSGGGAGCSAAQGHVSTPARRSCRAKGILRPQRRPHAAVSYQQPFRVRQQALLGSERRAPFRGKYARPRMQAVRCVCCRQQCMVR